MKDLYLSDLYLRFILRVKDLYLNWEKLLVEVLHFITYENIHITDKCDDVTCQNGGTCKLNDGKPFCECAVAYVGDYCEKCKYMSNSKIFSINFFITETLIEMNTIHELGNSC